LDNLPMVRVEVEIKERPVVSFRCGAVSAEGAECNCVIESYSWERWRTMRWERAQVRACQLCKRENAIGIPGVVATLPMRLPR
jgi:hypothetical protein